MRAASGVFLIFCSLAFITCNNRLTTQFAGVQHILIDSSQIGPLEYKGWHPCSDPVNSAPDADNPDHTPMAQLRINLHFMDLKTGEHNFNEEDGRHFARAVVNMCNERLANNVPMHLPPGNNTPVLPTRYRLKLTGMPGDLSDDGIYFHEDEDLYYYIHGKNTNRTTRAVIEKYSIQGDSVFNIFFMPHHPDSLNSKTYRAVGTGIMLGTSIKIAQVFERDPPPLSCVGLLNHELGHAIGLSHTWRGNDGCDDTPPHSNCFDYTNTPPCDSFVSNNLMDYNKWQHAMTPCQIGKVHRNIANTSARVRRFIEPYWCFRDTTRNVRIRDTVHWDSEQDLPGDVIIENDAVLKLTCRLGMPPGGRIVISPTGTLILDRAKISSACGMRWSGIEVQSKGRHTGSIRIYNEPVVENAVNELPITASEGR